MTDEALARVIAIDGPGGSGKSTVAKQVAAESGLPHLDTGAMYRAITLGLLERNIEPDDWARASAVLSSIDIAVTPDRVEVDGADATERIRSVEVTAAVSAVAANPAVREVLVSLQQKWIADNGGGVLEGRDIGTVVAPNASIKVFLTASVRARAERRALETGADVDEVEAELIRRDEYDSSRDKSPLMPACDAVELDTTELTIAEVVARIMALAVEQGLV